MDYRSELIELGLWDEEDLRDPHRTFAAAWRLEEKLNAAGRLMRLYRVDNGWSCYLHHRDTWVEIISGVQPTAALAISREIKHAWEELPTPRPKVLVEIFADTDEKSRYILAEDHLIHIVRPDPSLPLHLPVGRN